MSRNGEGEFPAGALAAMLALLAACQVYAFHWGVITPDTIFQWGQALSGSYDDWHPPATTWLWRQLMRFGPGTRPVLIFDVILYWIGIWLIADTLRRGGRPKAMALVVLCAALPIPFGQIGSILKDPLLTCCCLVACGLLLAFGETRGRSRLLAAVGASLLLLFATATRFNAVFATAPLLAAWLPSRRFLISIAGAGVLLAGGAWAIDNVALRPHHSQPIFSLVNFDLAGIAAHGGTGAYPNLDAAQEHWVTATCYDPGQFNPTYRPACDEVEEALRDYAREHRQSAVRLWARAVIRAPGAYLQHRLAHLNRNLRFLVADVPDDAVYVMTTPNPFGIGFHANAATNAVAWAAQIMAVSPLGRPALWIAVAVGLLLISRRLRNRLFQTAVCVSTILYGSAYAVVSVAPDLRYNLWTMLGAMMALVVAISDLVSARSAPAGRRGPASS